MLSKNDIKKIIVEMVNNYGEITLAKLVDAIPDKEGVFSDTFSPICLPDKPCTSLSWNLSNLILDSIAELVDEETICCKQCPAWYYLRDGWSIPRGMDIYGKDTTADTDHFVWVPISLVPWEDD